MSNAKPEVVSPPCALEFEDCYFYHTFDLPSRGTVTGMWDLRAGIDHYLGDLDFAGARVIDVGAASGYCSFHMERRGADVTSFDLGVRGDWDLVPFGGVVPDDQSAERRRHIEQLTNSYWFAHQAFGSAARAVHGSVYLLSRDVGEFDIAVIGSLLLHLRDPFLALQRVSGLGCRTLVISEVCREPRFGLPWGARPALRFLPRASLRAPDETWWAFTPALLRSFLEVLGFERVRHSYNHQLVNGKRMRVMTVVGQR